MKSSLQTAHVYKAAMQGEWVTTIVLPSVAQGSPAIVKEAKAAMHTLTDNRDGLFGGDAQAVGSGELRVGNVKWPAGSDDRLNGSDAGLAGNCENVAGNRAHAAGNSENAAGNSERDTGNSENVAVNRDK